MNNKFLLLLLFLSPYIALFLQTLLISTNLEMVYGATCYVVIWLSVFIPLILMFENNVKGKTK